MTSPAKSARDDKLTTATSYQKGAVKVHIKREESGVTNLSLDLSNVAGVRADKTFSADCCRIELRNNLPELQFGQLDPFDPKRMIRTAIMRYDTSLFIERIKAYEQFMKDLHNQFISHSSSEPEAAYRKLFEAAQHTQPAIAVFDVGLELALYMSNRMTFVFLTHSAVELNVALSGIVTSYALRAELEVTVPLNAGYELLKEWAALAPRLAS